MKHHVKTPLICSISLRFHFFVSLSVSIGDLTVFSVISRFNLVSVCRENLTDKKLNSQSIFSTGDIFFSDRQKSDRKN